MARGQKGAERWKVKRQKNAADVFTGKCADMCTSRNPSRVFLGTMAQYIQAQSGIGPYIWEQARDGISATGQAGAEKMADRLTYRPEAPYTNGKGERIEAYSDHTVREIINRLAAYEDTGLTPEMCAEYKKFEDEVIASGMTFGELVELMHAEKDGKLYTSHDVAVILASAIGDDCACNINSNDEWLPQVCELQEACPNTDGVACWEQYIKHRAEAEKTLGKEQG